MANPTETSVHSSQYNEEEEEELEQEDDEQEQEPGGETSDLEGREEEEDEAEFNDAESIQLGTYDEQTVLTIRRGGGVISNQKYNSLLEIRRELMESREKGNISNIRRELRNLSWELDKMGSVTCRAMLKLDNWGTLEDDMNMFADNYVQANKPREKVRCKAPVLTVEARAPGELLHVVRHHVGHADGSQHGGAVREDHGTEGLA